MSTPKSRIALYPGTFDPITYGHLDVIKRASVLFDRIIVTLAVQRKKEPLFTIAERLEMVVEATKDIPGIEVIEWDGLIVKYAEKVDAIAIIRGLRAISDFDYEFQMALANRVLSKNVSTVFLMPGHKYTYLNSSIVREVAMLGGEIEHFVPVFVAKALRKKVKELSK
ncbi:pantetheine-phosphate adenylyltransferase [bacterium]|nr:pantetheine-phosphate adenylyltransferase [bacterium]MBU1637444.1 pantetheine-phosphate adenylyltransferase [bacterium]MBU1920563.1 pantetheine-phosphate adenylyltransferase [bacterium]RQV99010.1 MAG: pantetheine-phosphate adenylyltransferase [bacterium]